MYVQHGAATGQETTPATVADSKGKQGDEPDRVSAKASRVMLKHNGRVTQASKHASHAHRPTPHERNRTVTMVTEYSWESDTWTHGDNPVRTAWREAVAEIAEKAKATLPECNGR